MIHGGWRTKPPREHLRLWINEERAFLERYLRSLQIRTERSALHRHHNIVRGPRGQQGKVLVPGSVLQDGRTLIISYLSDKQWVAVLGLFVQSDTR